MILDFVEEIVLIMINVMYYYYYIQYHIQYRSIKFRDNYFTSILSTDQKNCGLLRIKLFFIKNGAVRVKFYEMKNNKTLQRYEDNDVILLTSNDYYTPIYLSENYYPMYRIKKEIESCYITGNNITFVKIEYDPFKLSLYNKDSLHIILNEKYI